MKLSSWPEIRSDGDVLLTPYVPKGITGYDDDDDDDDDDESLRRFTFPPRRRRDLRSPGMLRSVQ